MRSTAWVLVVPLQLLFYGPDQSLADFIQPDTAVASSEFISGFDGRAVNTINGSGLPAGFGPADVHADYGSGNHWTTLSGNPTEQFIIWGFAIPQFLDTIYIWNHLSTVPPANNSGYDVTLFDLTLFDSSDNVLLALTGINLAPDTATSQSFVFGPTAGVSSVRFDIRAVQNSSTQFTGLAEVGFNVVPEPPSLLLLALASATIGMIRPSGRRL